MIPLEFAPMHVRMTSLVRASLILSLCLWSGWSDLVLGVPNSAAAHLVIGNEHAAASGDVPASWSGFTDPSGIAGYRYRVLERDANWTWTDQNQTVVTGLLDGEYTFAVAAEDASGATSPAVRAVFCRDSQGPRTLQAEITVNGAFACSLSSGVTLSWGGFEDVNRCPSKPALAGYEVRFFDGGTELPPDPPERPGWTVTPGIQLESLAEGNYRVEVRAVDRAGNRSAPVSRSFEVDTIKPAILLGGFWDSELVRDQARPFSFIAMVDDHRVDQVRVSYRDSRGSMRGIPYSVRDSGDSGDSVRDDGIYQLVLWSAEATPPGPFFFEFEARDPCGNRGDLWPYLTVGP